MTVIPAVPVSIAIAANPPGSVCDGTSVSFTALPDYGGINPSYQWIVNGINAGIDSDTYIYVPANGDSVICKLTSDAVCAISNPAMSNLLVAQTSPNLAVSVTINANPPGNVCEGTQVIYTAIPVNGGSSPSYQWKVNGSDAGLNSDIFIHVPVNNEIISCVVTSDEICTIGNPSNSNLISMIVDPALPVSLSISADAPGAVCEGTPVSFFASPVNGGSLPSYQWTVNGSPAGSDSDTYTYIPMDGDVVNCSLHSNATCTSGNPAISNSITIVVNPVLPVGVTIAATPSDTICSGTTVTLIATGINGGLSPSWQWKVNGNNAGTNEPQLTMTPVDGDLVYCIFVSDATCNSGSPATSDSVLFTVISNVVSAVSITSDPPGPICQGVPVTFTAEPLNGGTDPSYQWKVNGAEAGSNDPEFIYLPSDGDQVTCTMNSNEICVSGNPSTSNILQESVNPSNPVSVAVSFDPPLPFCEGGAITCTASGVNEGTSPVYQWLLNGINAGVSGPVYNYIPSVGDIVSCTLLSNVPCSVNNPDTSAALAVPVLPKPYVSLDMCIRLTSRDGKPITLRGGVPAGGIYSGPGVTGSLFDPASIPPALDSSMITYAYQSSNGCISSKDQYIVVKPSQAFLCGNNFIDIRDDKTYPTVQIGTQCWFAKNLDYGQFISSTSSQMDNCTVEKYCYSDIPANCSLGGGLYQWDEMMYYGTQTASQGYCPPGWHIPDETEWKTLFDLFNGNAYAGDQLKAGGMSGFNALLAGALYNNQEWQFKDYAGFFWSSGALGEYKSWAHGVNHDNHGVSYYPAYRSNAFSLRCIHD